MGQTSYRTSTAWDLAEAGSLHADHRRPRSRRCWRAPAGSQVDRFAEAIDRLNGTGLIPDDVLTGLRSGSGSDGAMLIVGLAVANRAAATGTARAAMLCMVMMAAMMFLTPRGHSHK